MGDIGGWWLARHERIPGETVDGSYPANQLRPDQRPLGGKLIVTSDRVLFSPHVLDRLLGGQKSAFSLDDIEDIDAVRGDVAQELDARLDLGGGGQPRVRIALQDTDCTYFIVPDVDAVTMTVRERLEHGAKKQ